MLWLNLRFWALRGTQPASSSLPWSTIILTAPKILLFNLYRTVFPLGLSPHYDFRLIETPSGDFLLTLLALLALVALAVAAARRDPRLWTAFAWLILPVLPTLDLRLMNEDDFIHDRYTLMSMLGVALLAGSFAYSSIGKKWPQQQLVRLLAAAIVVILAFANAIQSQYRRTKSYCFRGGKPGSRKRVAQLNYGSALSDRRRYGDAAPHFVRSYELKPGWRAADFAGFAYQQSGDCPRPSAGSELLCNRIQLWRTPGSDSPISLAQHNPDQAIDFLNQALTIQPTRRISLRVGNSAPASSRPSKRSPPTSVSCKCIPLRRCGTGRPQLQAAGAQGPNAGPARITSKSDQKQRYVCDQPLYRTDTNCKLSRRILARGATRKA